MVIAPPTRNDPQMVVNGLTTMNSFTLKSLSGYTYQGAARYAMRNQLVW